MQKPLNEMTLVFLSRSANESFSRSAAAAFFSQLDPTVEELADIKTAVSEAVTNCIVHAYRETLGKIKMTARIYEGGQVYIQIKDTGCGIPDVKQAMEPLFTTCETGERAGRHAVLYGQGVRSLQAGKRHHRHPAQNLKLQNGQ